MIYSGQCLIAERLAMIHRSSLKKQLGNDNEVTFEAAERQPVMFSG